jgi:anti-sigma B factor antagonist
VLRKALVLPTRTISGALNSQEKSTIPTRRLVAAMIVEGCMQALTVNRTDGNGIAHSNREEPGVTVMRVAIPPSSNLKISVDQVGKDAVVRLSGRIDVDSSPDLRDRLRTILSEEALPQTIIVDLAGVSYVETSGVATLIEALRIARHHHINFRLQGLSGATLRLFEVTGVLALFDANSSGQKVS